MSRLRSILTGTERVAWRIMPKMGLYFVQRLRWVKVLPAATFAFASIASAGCEDCWEPRLNFDIDGQGFMGSMIFISGQSYALSATSDELKRKGAEGYFCATGDIGSKELIEILNKRLSGVVTAEKVTQQIVEGLKERYPCEGKR